MSDAPEGRLSGDEIAAMGLGDWRSIRLSLRSRFRTGNFLAGLHFVQAVAEAAEQANHHPDVDLRYPYVDIALSSHDVHAKTRRDVDLARRISEIARDQGITADPGVVQELELGLDTWDADEIRPFWAAVLGLQTGPRFEDELVDPAGRLPTIWFQASERHREPHQRFHLDIRVPPEVAKTRIRDAIAAGGVMVSDENAPRFTVLADAQDNKVCVCTHIGRDD